MSFYLCDSESESMVSNVLYFNPTCELAIANGSFSYMPPKLLRDFESDCSVLPFLFASPGDCILTERKPTPAFTSRLGDLNFPVPAFLSLKEAASRETWGHLYPWGWSPATHFYLKELKDHCCPVFKESPVFNWQEKHKLLFERSTSLEFLYTLLENHAREFFIQREHTGIRVNSVYEVEQLLTGHKGLVLKAPLSSSGRGIQMIRKGSLNASNKQWISGVLNQQKYLVAEPFLDKLADLSFQFKITDQGGPDYLGYSVFETNSNGQYKGTMIRPEIARLFPMEIADRVKFMIEQTAEQLTLNLKHSIFTHEHRGYLGIDAMIYHEGEAIKMQPCIEINSRMNMGILAKQIEKYIHPESTGQFELFYGKPGEFHRYASLEAMKKPMKMKNGLLTSGFLSLVEPDETTQFGAYILLQDS